MLLPRNQSRWPTRLQDRILTWKITTSWHHVSGHRNLPKFDWPLTIQCQSSIPRIWLGLRGSTFSLMCFRNKNAKPGSWSGVTSLALSGQRSGTIHAKKNKKKKLNEYPERKKKDEGKTLPFPLLYSCLGRGSVRPYGLITHLS